MSTIFFTGFPGFLGRELLPRVLRQHESKVSASCLVQTRHLSLAEENVAQLIKTHPELEGRIKLYEGDITEPDLGLGTGRLNYLKGQTIQAYHLAAVYDLGVDRELATRVNIDGTRHVLAFLRRASKLERLHYVSTCYVSGRYHGLFREEDLEVGQAFQNHYEESKFYAERLVRDAREDGVPVTIYRPAIVVGDSTTGETQKYDGPYYVIRWLLKMPDTFAFPSFIGSQNARVNVVPRDYVVDAITYLSSIEGSLNKTYQLCDPRPLRVGEMVQVLADAAGKRLYSVPLPAIAAKLAVRYVEPLREWMQIPEEALDYFTLPTVYSAENTLQDLKESGISCPAFREYARRLVAFAREHPEVSSRAMT